MTSAPDPRTPDAARGEAWRIQQEAEAGLVAAAYERGEVDALGRPLPDAPTREGMSDEEREALSCGHHRPHCRLDSGAAMTAPDPSAEQGRREVHDHEVEGGPEAGKSFAELARIQRQGLAPAVTAPDPSERAGEGLTEAERETLTRAVAEQACIHTGGVTPGTVTGCADCQKIADEGVIPSVERILADRMAARAGEVAEVIAPDPWDGGGLVCICGQAVACYHTECLANADDDNRRKQ